MSERVDYVPAIKSLRPPEGLVGLLMNKGLLSQEYLIYRSTKIYEPLSDMMLPYVEVTCTNCGCTFIAEKEDAGGCEMNRPPAPFGWLDELGGKAVITGENAFCRECGGFYKTVHVTNVGSGMEEYAYPTQLVRIPMEGKRDRLAVVDWRVTRKVDKQGNSQYQTKFWSASIVEENKLVRVMGYRDVFIQAWYETRSDPCAIYQPVTFRDCSGTAEPILEWDRSIFEGTTAENSRLDLYIEAGGNKLVGYLMLWMKYPAAENLLVQGHGKILAALINEKREDSYYNDHKAPVPDCIDWKEKRPNRMLHMSLEEYRCFGRQLTPAEYKTLFWLKEKALPIPDGIESIRVLSSMGSFQADMIYKEVGERDFWRCVRYLIRQIENMITLRDYWRMARVLLMDVDNQQVRWPKDLKAAHDRVTERYNNSPSETEKIEEKYYKSTHLPRLMQYSWERDGILIRPCKSCAELRKEGKALDHCVARYAHEVMNGDTAIFFIRRADKPDKPWYTLELGEKTLTVEQNRGKRNCDRTPEIYEFERAWLEWLKENFSEKKKAGQKAS